jgi:uncharacterized protein
MHYLLIYDLADDYLTRRTEYRNQHLALSWAASNRSELVIGVALADPADQAILMFQCDSPEVPANFARNDPYVQNGLVKEWRVRQWSTVVGANAAAPVHPAS